MGRVGVWSERVWKWTILTPFREETHTGEGRSVETENAQRAWLPDPDKRFQNILKQ